MGLKQLFIQLQGSQCICEQTSRIMLIFKDVEGEKAARIAAAQPWWELSGAGRRNTSVEGGSDFPSVASDVLK